MQDSLSIHVLSSFGHPQQCLCAQYSPSLHLHYSAQPPALLMHTSSPTCSHMHSVLAPCDLHQCPLCISPCMCFSHSKQLQVVSNCWHFSAQPHMHPMCTPAPITMLFSLQCCMSGSHPLQWFPRLVQHHQGHYLVYSALCFHSAPSLSFVSPPWACFCPWCLRTCTLFLIWKDAITIGLLFAPYSFPHLSFLLYVLEVPGSTLLLPI